MIKINSVGLKTNNRYYRLTQWNVWCSIWAWSWFSDVKIRKKNYL